MSEEFERLAEAHPDAKTGELLRSLHQLSKSSAYRDQYQNLLFETLSAVVLGFENLQNEMRARLEACEAAVGIDLLDENRQPIFPRSSYSSSLPDDYKTVLGRLAGLEERLEQSATGS